ncbi:aminotransferase-like domain-containing protein [Plantactinospora soyae]|uniref:(S)-3,5-dihydroxyphenylglycine transaminase n=1 Tax=Plantactinospora soyae TaxID=1544732 RepID=A0A927MEP3_9ACTN|nr:PLP-dependent aminotransferase family protein [Plantactinospora soyae]MBE1489745.1 (S)-3,5-dihydroxyphenylglycine transaminase [Plantactinospora soyae]
MVEIARAELHVSVSDPVASSMNFLNEVAGRHPRAISLAAGRPYDGFYSVDDIAGYQQSYVDYLLAGGLSWDRVPGMLLQYGRTNGQLGELISRMLEIDENIVVSPESVMVTAGCQEAMIIVLRALCSDPDDVVLAVEPCYVGLTGAARILGVDAVPVPESIGGVDPETVAEVARRVRAAGKRPRALYLVPNFSNPSGASLPTATRRRLLDVAAEQDLLLLEDDPYGLFGTDDEPRPTLKSLDTGGRVIYLGSFAKSCFPGARVGFLVADQIVVDRAGRRTLLADEMSAIKSMLTVNTSPIAQAVIGGILVESDCSLRTANRDKIAFYRNNLRVLLASLDEHFPQPDRDERGVRWNVPGGGFFVVVDVPFRADEKLLERSAEQFGVLWTPMSFFYADGGHQSIRLSCSYLEADRLAEGVRRLSQLVAATV